MSVTVSDAHADTIRPADAAVALRSALMSSLAVTGPLYTHETYDEGMAALDALVADLDRERARADRAEAALVEVVKRSRSYYASSAARTRVMGEITEIANAALSAGSGKRETT